MFTQAIALNIFLMLKCFTRGIVKTKMFRKIVSSLPFSPALVGQLGFYAKKLRKEIILRRLGLIFVVLALIAQSLAVFQPPESANASNQNDMVNGGAQSLSDLLKTYDSNVKNFKDIINYIGITRNEIASTKFESWKVDNKISWGFVSHFSYDEGERQYNISDNSGNQVTTIYSRPSNLLDNSNKNVYGWIGKSDKIGWFAFAKENGNLTTDNLPKPISAIGNGCNDNPTSLKGSLNCQYCSSDSTLWASDPRCNTDIVKIQNATNISQGFIPASSTVATPGDNISYTIVIKNNGDQTKMVKIEDSLSDILEYAYISDAGGGNFNPDSMVLSWPDASLSPHSEQSRTFIVNVLDSIPSTTRGTSDRTSYDCVISNIFGNSINIKLSCPAIKIVEQIIDQLPTIGPIENIAFAAIALSITTYFYARARQTKKEIKVIRHDATTGLI